MESIIAEETTDTVENTRPTYNTDIETCKQNIVQANQEIDTLMRESAAISLNIPNEILDNILENYAKFLEGSLTTEEIQNLYPNPDSHEHSIITKMLEVETLTKDVDQIEEKYKTLRIIELEKLAMNILNTINYEAFFEYFDNTDYEFSQNISTLIKIDQVIRDSKRGILQNNDYAKLDNLQSILVREYEKWEKLGLVKDTSNIEETEKDDLDNLKTKRIDLIERIKEDISLVHEYAQLKNDLKVFSPESESAKNRLNELLQLLNYKDNYDSEETAEEANIEYNPRLLNSIQKFLLKKTQQLQSEDILPTLDSNLSEYFAQERQLDIDKLLESIQILGFEEIDGLRLLISSNEIRDLLKNNLSPHFFKRIGSISFINKPIDNNKEIMTGGITFPEYDSKGNIINSRIEIYYSPHVLKDTDNETINLRLNIIKEIMLHEVGHTIHRELTFEEMLEWKKISDLKDIEVSWYIGRIKKTKPACLTREDFCESFQLYLLHPEKLEIDSPDRYNYFSKLLKKYSNEQ